MFTFTLKDNKADIETSVTRALLAVAAVGAFIFPNEHFYLLSILLGGLLLVASWFVKKIVARFGISRIVLLAAASVIVYFTTGSIGFAIVLLAYGAALEFLYKTPQVIVAEKGIILKKPFTTTLELWPAFNNVILKDGLLTLDFTNNKLLQLAIDEEKTKVDEVLFNEFARKQLGDGGVARS